MGPFPRAVLIACLTMLKWLCWVTTALLLLLIASQFLRGETTTPGQFAIAALAMAALGWFCGKAAAWFERASQP